MYPVIEVPATPGNVPGTYAIGCVPMLDPDTRQLTIGPGVFRLPKPPEEAGEGIDLADELVFPSGEVTLPEDAIEVWIGRHRSSGEPTLIVNVGQGIDTFTYEPCYVVYRFGTAHRGQGENMERFPAHILCYWRTLPKDRQRWVLTKYGTPPEDMEEFRGEPAAVVVQSEMPEHVQQSIGRREAARTALHALSVLARVPVEEWSDAQMREALINLIKANPDIELPPGLAD